MIASDKWNTRAWILQEAFASSGNMLLLFPRADNIDIRGWLLICHEMSQTEIAVGLDVIQDCLQMCWPYVQRIFASPKSKKRDNSTGSNGETPSVEDLKLATKRLQHFHPRHPEEGETLRVSNMKLRRTCNAATAVTYLKLRGLVRIADKIAITANLCGYVLRFNTIELEKSQQSLAGCIVALALANGDFSLITPQIYRQPSKSKKPDMVIQFPAPGTPEFSWAHSMTKCLDKAHADAWDPYGVTAGVNAAAFMRLSEEGLSFPGILWALDEMIDLRHLQIKYAEPWTRLRKATRPPSAQTLWRATTHLLFEIINHLVSVGQNEAADSIWNSTSNYRWMSRDRFARSDVIESVGQFPPGLRTESRKGMFRLEPSSDGAYHQCWIVDRVMEKGCLWTFKVVDTRVRDEELDDERFEERGNPEEEEKIANESMNRDLNVIMPEAGTQDINPRTPEQQNKSHSHAMFVGYLLSKMVELTSLDVKGQEVTDDGTQSDKVGNHVTVAPAALSAFALGLDSGMGRHSGEAYKRRAIFDVDGNPDGANMVLTPWQMVLESVPRPASRSMSISWVVQRVVAEDDGDEDGKSREDTFRIDYMVSGMWKYALCPSGRYTIV